MRSHWNDVIEFALCVRDDVRAAKNGSGLGKHKCLEFCSARERGDKGGLLSHSLQRTPTCISTFNVTPNTQRPPTYGTTVDPVVTLYRNPSKREPEIAMLMLNLGK